MDTQSLASVSLNLIDVSFLSLVPLPFIFTVSITMTCLTCYVNKVKASFSDFLRILGQPASTFLPGELAPLVKTSKVRRDRECGGYTD